MGRRTCTTRRNLRADPKKKPEALLDQRVAEDGTALAGPFRRSGCGLAGAVGRIAECRHRGEVALLGVACELAAEAEEASFERVGDNLAHGVEVAEAELAVLEKPVGGGLGGDQTHLQVGQAGADEGDGRPRRLIAGRRCRRRRSWRAARINARPSVACRRARGVRRAPALLVERARAATLVQPNLQMRWSQHAT